MSTSPNLPAGAFITTIGGRRCTAMPKPGGGGGDGQLQAATAAAEAAPTAAQQAAATAVNPAVADTISTTIPTFGQAPATVAPLAQSEVTDLPIPAPTESAALRTTIGFVPGTAAAGDAAQATGAGGPAISLVPQEQGTTGAPTVIIVGSVVGGVAVISLVAFMLWYWRKRVMRKRRSTLLTPLSTDPRTFGGGNGAVGSSGEKGNNFTIDRGSLGPTPRTEKVRAALGYNFKRLRGNLSVAFSRNSSGTPSVNMNRGTSQFMDGASIPQHTRNNSGLSNGAASKTSELTTKDRFMDWWGRLTADVSFNWRVRNDRNAENDPFAAARDMKERRTVMGGGNQQPDFLTLLSMDDREVDREAQRRRLSKNRPGSAGSGRSSASSRSGSRTGSGSGKHFLGGLNLNFDRDDPFSDSNAIRAHDSAKVAPLQVSKSDNPFSDFNAITAPLATRPAANYVANVRRSRGQSTSGGNGGASGAGSGMPTRQDSVYNRERESVNSVDSFQARRNKFRSDPFDLDRPELLSANRQKVTSSNISTAGDSEAPRLSSNTAGSGLARGPSRRTRGDSFTSKYSSGISMGDWSDPGPDVGPAASRWDSPTEGWRSGEQSPRRTSNGSQRSVGKAL